MLLLWRYDGQAQWWVWMPIVVLSGLILLTHKMTTQVFWFTILGHRPHLSQMVAARTDSRVDARSIRAERRVLLEGAPGALGHRLVLESKLALDRRRPAQRIADIR
jgi:hypothetical protein